MKSLFIYHGDVCIGHFCSESLEYIWEVVNTFISKGKNWSFEIELMED